MNLKTLTLVVAMTAAIAPAQAQVSGGFAFQMPIFNANGKAVFNGVPSGRDTQVYDFKGRYVGRVTAKAFVDGRTVSLLDLHIGCVDKQSAQVAQLAPNSADRTKCGLMTPTKPYFIVETWGPLPGTESRQPSGVCACVHGEWTKLAAGSSFMRKNYTQRRRNLGHLKL